MKQVNLSLEPAKEMYNSNNSFLKKFALENYTEEELTKKKNFLKNGKNITVNMV